MAEINYMDQVVNCKIEVRNPKAPRMAAGVKVITEESKSDVLENGTGDYISESLGISIENISIAYEYSYKIGVRAEVCTPIKINYA